MKRKTGGSMISLLLAGIIAINMFPIGGVRVTATDDTQPLTGQTDVPDTGTQDDHTQDNPQKDDSTKDNPQKDDPAQDNPTQDDPAQDDHTQDDPQQDDSPKDQKIELLVDHDVLAELIRSKCQKTYDGKVTVSNVQDKDELIFVPTSTQLFIYYMEESQNGGETPVFTKKYIDDIEKIKIVCCFVNEKGEPDANVAVDAGGQITDKAVRIQSIQFKKDKSWTEVKEFFSSDLYTLDEKALNPDDLKSRITPCAVNLVMNKAPVEYYKGQQKPVITDDAEDAYYYTPVLKESKKGSLDDLDTKQIRIVDENGQMNAVLSGTQTHNYQLFVVSNKNTPVSYTMKSYRVPDDWQPKVSYRTVKKDEIYIRYATLTAPDHYQLSISDGEDATWSDKIQLVLDEHDKAAYYVRHIEKNTDTYLAVSDEQVWKAVADIKAVSTIKSTAVDENGNVDVWKKIFRELDNIFYTNMDLTVTTDLTSAFPTNTKIIYTYTEADDKKVKEAVEINMNEWTKNANGTYTVSNVIDLEKVENNSAKTYFILDIQTENAKYASLVTLPLRTAITEKDENGKEVTIKERIIPDVTIVVDKIAPTATCTFESDENGNESLYRVKINTSSGIVKVAYRWDDLSFEKGQWVRSGKKSFQNADKFYQKDSDSYLFDVMSIDKAYPVEDGRHTLHIRVIDQANNIPIFDFTPVNGIDTMAPVLQGTKLIRENADDHSVEELDWNELYAVEPECFFNQDVSLLVQADDVKSSTGSKTGLKSVTFGDVSLHNTNYSYQDSQWFKFDLTNGHLYDLTVKLKDNKNNEKIQSLFEAVSTLIVENQAPEITEVHLVNQENVIVDNSIHHYNKSYYNEKLKLVVSANDVGLNNVTSGVRNIFWQKTENPERRLFVSKPEKISLKEKDASGHKTEQEPRDWYVFELDWQTEYQLNLWAVDNAGNSSEKKTFAELTGLPVERLYLDNVQPDVESIELLKIIQPTISEEPATPEDTEQEVRYEPLNATEYVEQNAIGYYHAPVRVRVKAHDDNAGVLSVRMGDRIFTKETLTETITTDEGETEQTVIYYSTDLPVGEAYELTLTVTDKAGNKQSQSAENILCAGQEEKMFGLKTLLLESDQPESMIRMPEHKVQTEYYGLDVKEEGVIHFTMTDPVVPSEDGEQDKARSGMQSYTITDTYNDRTEILEQWDGTALKEVLYEKKTSVDMLQFDNQDGKHTLTVTLTDMAGNQQIITQNFYVDYTAPQAAKDSDGGGRHVLSVKSPSEKSKARKTIGTELWFDGTAEITMQAQFEEANIDHILVDIEGKPTEDGTPTKSIIFTTKKKTDKITVVPEENLNTVSFTFNNDSICVDDQNCYTVTAKAVDRAGNVSELKKIVLHRDFAQPVVTKVVVKNVDDNSVISVLRRKFGVFANGEVLLIVHANDTDAYRYDSGMDKVTVSYQGLTDVTANPDDPMKTYSYTDDSAWSESYPMFYDSANNRYMCILTGENFKKNIRVVAYDQFGKKSTIVKENESVYPNIDGTRYGDETENSSRLVLIESKEPTITITMPQSNGEAGADGKTWYNADRSIKLFVQDGGSGIRSIKVTVNGKAVTQDSQKTAFLTDAYTQAQDNRIIEGQHYVLMTEDLVKTTGEVKDGRYTLKVTAKDNSGNEMTQTAVFWRDTKEPSVDKFTFTPASKYGTNPSDKDTDKWVQHDPAYGFYFPQDFYVTIKVTDPAESSGLNMLYYQLVPYNGEKSTDWHQEKIQNGAATFEVKGNFKGQIYVKAQDNVGNVCTAITPKSFVIDTPERHQLDTPHIEIKGWKETAYRDENGHALYTGPVTFTVTLRDTVSGIESFTYQTTSEKTTGANAEVKKISFDKAKAYHKNEQLADGWFIAAMESNLVTEVSRTYTFNQDDNNIRVTWHTTDRAGNTSDMSGNLFTIDQTAPVIQVDFAGDNLYYNAGREATITVTERNFDAGRISSDIQNTLAGKTNNKPVIRFAPVQGTNNRYQATFTFTEGDYTFAITGTDRGEHQAVVNYVHSNSQKFYVDATDPVFEGFSAAFTGEKLYKESQTMKLKVREHHFDPSKIVVRLTRNGNVINHTNQWISNGDNHEMTIAFTDDGIYQATISGEDRAGRKLTNAQSGIFEIDQTSPQITVAFNGSGDCFKETRTGTITVNEKNFEAKNITVHCSKDGADTVIPCTYTTEGNVHTATFTLSEGDYLFVEQGNNAGRTESDYQNFSVYGKDKAGNIAVVSYTGDNRTDFHVDNTPPVFKGFEAAFQGQQLYKSEQTITLLVEEHNFDASKITANLTKNGSPISNTNQWTQSGDNYTMVIHLTEDGIYQVTLSGEDKAGISLKAVENQSLQSGIVEIDKTSPEVTTASDTVILTSDQADQTNYIVFQDASENMRSVTGKCTGFVLKEEANTGDRQVVKRMEDISPADVSVSGNEGKTASLSVDPSEYFARDNQNKVLQGVYTFELSADDLAGNETSSFTKQYIVLDGDFVAYIPADQYEAYHKKKINSEKLSGGFTLDIYAQPEVAFRLDLYTDSSAGDEVVSLYGSDASVTQNPCITNVSTEEIARSETAGAESLYCNHYQLVFSNELASMIDENNTSEVDKTLNIVPLKNGTADVNNKKSLITFMMDNDDPTGVMEDKFLNMNRWLDGYYGELPMKVKIQNVPTDLDWQQCVFMDNDEVLEKDKDVSWENGEIIVTVRQQGNHKFDFKLVDEVGNETKIQMGGDDAIYFGSFMGRWWVAFLIGGLLIAVGIVWLAIALVRKKKR